MVEGPKCPVCGLSMWVEIGGGTFQERTEDIPVYHPNIDAREGTTVDIVADLEVEDIPLHDGHAEIIKMMHFLQHLGFNRAKYILNDCLRVLKPGGQLFVMVGDMEFFFRTTLKEGLQHKWAMGIWGEQEHKYDYHKWGYTFESLSSLLRKVGFINIQHRGYYNPWEFKVEAVKP